MEIKRTEYEKRRGKKEENKGRIRQGWWKGVVEVAYSTQIYKASNLTYSM